MQDGNGDVRVDRDEAGRTRTRYRLHDGKLDGELLQYDEQERVVARLPYRCGVLHGEALFYERGELQMRTHYENGVEQGERVMFAQGQPSMTGRCKNGKLEGEATWHRPGGSVQRVAHYVDGLLEGESVDYNERGRVIQRTTYRAGVQQK